MKLIKIEKWGTFNIGELFDIHPTKAYKLTTVLSGGSCGGCR